MCIRDRVVASFLAKRSYKYFQGQSTVRGEQTALVNEMIEEMCIRDSFNLRLQANNVNFDQYLKVRGQTVEQFRTELHAQACLLYTSRCV